MTKPKGLGKGLDSLISKKYVEEEKPQKQAKQIKEEKDAKGQEVLVDIALVSPNREQPRKNFDEAALNELADSIKQHGIIQPLIVAAKGKGYEIIAGERRYRAAQLAGLKKLPVIIRDYSEKEKSEIALIENIQREDLNAIEEAKAYEKLIKEFGLKQEELAERVSKSRVAITNHLRLLKLSEKIQQLVIDGSLSEGHARALLGAETKAAQEKFAKIVLEKKLNVRQTEELVKKSAKPAKKKKTKTPDDEIYAKLEDELKEVLCTKVNIKRESQEKGKIVVEYYSLDELDRLTDLFKKNRKD